MGTGATTTASSGAIHPRQRIAQNFLLVWVDANINQSNKDCQNTLTHLRNVVNDVNIFNQPDQCMQFLKDTQNEKASLVHVLIKRVLKKYSW